MREEKKDLHVLGVRRPTKRGEYIVNKGRVAYIVISDSILASQLRASQSNRDS